MGEDILYSQGFALPHENQATYASLSHPFPFNYGPLQVMNTPRLLMQEPKADADLVDPLVVPDLNELVGKGKSLHNKALENMNFLRKE